MCSTPKQAQVMPVNIKLYCYEIPQILFFSPINIDLIRVFIYWGITVVLFGNLICHF